MPSRAIAIAALAFVAALPALYALSVRIRGPFGACPDGDIALIELAIRHAMRFEQFLGPYSRFEWNHPGPLLFYLVAPLYVWFREDLVAMLVGACLVNAVSVATVVVATYRLRGATGALLGAIVGCWTLITLGGVRIDSIWGPHVIVAPLLTVLVLTATVTAGYREFLPALVVAGSFVAQTHVAAVPVVVVAFVVAFVRACKLSQRDSSRHRTVILSVGLALMTLLWALPIAEELRGPRRNLAEVIRFFIAPGGLATFPLTETAPAVLLRTGDAIRALLPERAAPPVFIQILVVLQLLLLAATTALAVRRRDSTAIAATSIAALAAVVAFFSATRIVFRLNSYLFDWMAAVGTFDWLSIGLALLPPALTSNDDDTLSLGAWVRRSAAGWLLLIASASWGVRALHRDGSFGEFATSPPRALCIAGADVRRYLARTHGTRVLAIIDSHEVWPLAAGLLLSLQKHGIDFNVERDYVSLFGRLHERTGDEQIRLHFASERAFLTSRSARPVTRVATDGQRLVVFQETALGGSW